MLTLMDQFRHPFVASDGEALIARDAVSKLRPIADAGQDVRVRVVESPDVIVPLPARAVELVVAILDAMAERKPVSFVPLEAELTTQQAADFLNVSRPHLVSLVERGDIACRKVGTHRRLRFEDVLAFRSHSEQKRRSAARSG